MQRKVGQAVVSLVRGDITQQVVDAIVNAANSELVGGGGVDGAIHDAAGPSLMAACRDIRAKQGGCPTGSAVATHAGELQARLVFHAVGPRWRDGAHGEEPALRGAYAACMRLAQENAVVSIAFPAISTGIYGFPVERAAGIALRTVMDALPGSPVRDARFVLFSDYDLAVYEDALTAIPVSG